MLAVDTGFIVHNDRTYPHLRRLFDELGVRTRPTEMSLSIHDELSGVEYAGGRGAKGLFAQPRRAVDPRFLSVLAQVKWFHNRAQRIPEPNRRQRPDHLRRVPPFTPLLRTSFTRLYAVPLVSCVWSMGTEPHWTTPPGISSGSSTTTAC